MQTDALRTRVSRPGFDSPGLDDPGLALRWRALEGGASPFRSWAWVGCLATERYPDPVLVEVHRGEALAGMALFNRTPPRLGRRGGTLHLHASGIPRLDSVFTEHNGPVGDTPGVFEAVLAGLRRTGREVGRVVLPGLDEAGLAAVRAAGGIAVGLQTRAAPYAVLAVDGVEFAAGLSRNTRAQLRRSDRSYAAAGPIVVERAEGVGQALEWLAAMLPLHEATWLGRDVQSGFMAPDMQRFARALLERGVPGGEVDMLRVTAGPRLVGYLLNLSGGGVVMNYQAGFDYAGATSHEKPGWTCHHAAARRARAMGLREYDFLAGDAQYKRSLGTSSRALHWVTWKPWPALFGMEAVVRRWLRR